MVEQNNECHNILNAVNIKELNVKIHTYQDRYVGKTSETELSSQFEH